MPNGEEETADGKVFLFVCLDISDADISEEVAVSLTFGRDCVP